MIQVAKVDADTDNCAGGTHGCSLAEVSQLVVAYGVNEISNDHKQDDKQEIICHLHVVGINLERRKYSCNNESPQIFAPVGQHHSGYHRRKICQRHYFPYMSGGNDYEEIA